MEGETGVAGVTSPLHEVGDVRRVLASRVFFGHQSVGANVLEGVARLLSTDRSAAPRIEETRDAAQMATPGIYHARIGRNGDPASKLEAFVSILRDERAPDVAVFKFCYVDVAAETDPTRLFETYRAMMRRLRGERPDLTLVHVTIPLAADRGWLFHLRTLLRGKGELSLRRLNQKRHAFNELMRSEYVGEPVYDLAAVEATGADGRLRSVRYRGELVPCLADEWTSDGSHLNEAGQLRAARRLLDTLAAVLP